MVVIQWIFGYPTDWKPFVCNRVQEIPDLFEPEHWNHCCCEDNAADQASRGSSFTDLQRKCWTGPCWLTEEPSKWPNTERKVTQDQDLLEKRKTKDERLSSNIAQVKTNKEPLFDTARFEKWSKIVAVTACVMKCYTIWKGKALKKSTPSNHGVENTNTKIVDDIKQAEMYWMKQIQEGCYTDEIKSLQQQQRIHPKSMFRPPFR